MQWRFKPVREIVHAGSLCLSVMSAKLIRVPTGVAVFEFVPNGS